MLRHRSRFPSYPGISGHDLYGSSSLILGIGTSLAAAGCGASLGDEITAGLAALHILRGGLGALLGDPVRRRARRALDLPARTVQATKELKAVPHRPNDYGEEQDFL